MSVLIPRTRFGQKLRHELDGRGMSLRSLARRLNPQHPEVARRNLARWIGGYNEPSRINRIAVARAFGMPDDSFLDEDDEESDPLVKALMPVVLEAVRVVREVVHA